MRTKQSIARHLTWDSYQDLSNPYTQLKFKKAFQEIWSHNEYCAYTVYTKNAILRHIPIANILMSKLMSPLILIKKYKIKNKTRNLIKKIYLRSFQRKI